MNLTFRFIPQGRGCLIIDDESGAVAGSDRLTALAEAWAQRLAGPRGLVFLYIPNTVDGVAALLGAWQAGHVVSLLDPQIAAEPDRILNDRYAPDWVIRPDLATGLLSAAAQPGGAPALSNDLALLLSTSGSTGSPKFVRLSFVNIISNAEAIASVLDIRADEVGCAHLPLHYSYGLSVLTSHLIVGAPVWLTARAFTDREFWARAREAQIAHLPGVPFHYHMMQRLRFDRLDLPHLRVLTQAGGNLELGKRHAAHDFMSGRGGRFHVMYGQTEASPRITTLSHDDFTIAPDSVGTALPGGALEIVDATGAAVAVGEEGLVRYRGPNVMLGYAETRDDLARGDDLGGILDTGDIGRLDDMGRLTITGRAKRFGKILGLRVNLDEIEAYATELFGPNCVIQKDDQLHIFFAQSDHPVDHIEVIAALARRYNIPRTAYRAHDIAELPRTERGKPDYRRLELSL